MNITDVGHMTDDAEGGEHGEDRMAVAGRRLAEAKKSGKLPKDMADKIDLMRDTHVTAVTTDEMFVSIVVEEKQALIGTSRLMMMFDAKSLELRQWVVTDPQGFDTTIAVSNLDSNRRPDPNMFRIDYTDYRRDR